MEIPTFTKDEGIDLLSTLLGKNKGEDQAIEKIVKLVGAFPLALSHVAGVAITLNVSLAEYLELYGQEEHRVLQQKAYLCSKEDCVWQICDSLHSKWAF